MKQRGINYLSKKEVELIECIGKGYSFNEIATMLNTSLKKIELQQVNITAKLRLKNTAELSRYIIYSQLELEERFAI